MENKKKELLDAQLEDELAKCGQCGICRAYCPVFDFTKKDSYNTRGRLLLIKALKEGKLPFNKEALDRIYSCSLCKICDEACPPKVNPSSIIEKVRSSLAEMDIGPLAEHRQMVETIKKSGNVLGVEVRLDEVSPIIKSLPDKAPNLLYVGCVASTTYPNIVEATVKLLKQGNIDFTMQKEGEYCCGQFLGLVGLSKETSSIIENSLRAIREKEIKNVVTICPFCLSAFRTISNGSFTAQHSTQLLYDLVKTGKLKLNRKVDAVVTYFDPCHLGRGLKIFEEPRNLIKAIPGIKLVEMERAKQPAARAMSRCCGGTIRVPYMDIRTGMSEAIMKSAKDAGAEYLITACPTCHHNLRVLSFEYDIKVCNIEEIVGYSAGVVEEIAENL